MARQVVLRRLMKAGGKNLSPSTFVGEASRMEDLVHFRPMSEITTYTSTDLLTMYRAAARTANERASSLTADRIDPRDVPDIVEQIFAREADLSQNLLYPVNDRPSDIYYKPGISLSEIFARMRRGSPSDVATLYQSARTLAPLEIRNALDTQTVLPYLAEAQRRFQEYCLRELGTIQGFRRITPNERQFIHDVYDSARLSSIAREAVLRRLMEAGKRTA